MTDHPSDLCDKCGHSRADHVSWCFYPVPDCGDGCCQRDCGCPEFKEAQP